MEYVEYGSWVLGIVGVTLYSYVAWRNEQKIPKDYEGLICVRCKKPCEESELMQLEGFQLRLLKVIGWNPERQLDQYYCLICKKIVQAFGYLGLIVVIPLILMLIFYSMAFLFGG